MGHPTHGPFRGFEAPGVFVRLVVCSGPDGRRAGRDSAELGSPRFREGGGAQHGSAALEDDANRHIDEQLAEAPLVLKSTQEGAVLELLEKAGPDASADVE